MQTGFLENREKHLGQYVFETVNVKIFKLLKNTGNVSEKLQIYLTDTTKVELIWPPCKMNTLYIKLSLSCVKTQFTIKKKLIDHLLRIVFLS